MHPAPTNQMQVQMADRLAAVSAGVDDEPVPALVHAFLSRQLAGHGKPVAHQGRAGSAQRGKVQGTTFDGVRV